jgi:hypothetical protein
MAVQLLRLDVHRHRPQLQAAAHWALDAVVVHWGMRKTATTAVGVVAVAVVSNLIVVVLLLMMMMTAISQTLLFATWCQDSPPRAGEVVATFAVLGPCACASHTPCSSCYMYCCIANDLASDKCIHSLLMPVAVCSTGPVPAAIHSLLFTHCTCPCLS